LFDLRKRYILRSKILAKKSNFKMRSVYTRTNTTDSAINQPYLDLALAFAWSRRKLLVTLAIVPILIQLLVNFLLYEFAFAPGNMFLLLVVAWVANGFLLTAVTMLTIESLQRKTFDLQKLVGRSLRFLPKVLFSVVAVSSLVLIFLIVPTASMSMGSLVFLGFAFFTACFLLWAPAFCVGEFYAPIEEDAPDIDESEDEIGEVSSIRPARVAPSFITMKLFTNKYLWDLGLFRSVRLSGLFWPLTVKVLLLCWLALALPASLVEFLFGNNQLLAGSITIVASRILGVFVICIWAVMFLQILPPGARKEISLPVALGSDWFEQEASSCKFSLEGKRNLFGIVFTLCLFCSWYVQHKELAGLNFPEAVEVEVKSARLRSRELIVHLKLSDKEDRYRWFFPAAFNLRAPVESVSAKEGKGDEQKEAVRKISPYKFEVREFNGAILDANSFKPHDGDIEVALYFNDAVDVGVKGEVSLWYSASQSEKKVWQGIWQEN